MTSRRVLIIGAGHVGSHAAYALAEQGIADEIVFIDVDTGKAKAQALDIYDATVYLPHRVIVRAGDYTDVKDADVIVLSVGTNPDKNKGQTRMSMLDDTVAIVRDIAEQIKDSGFKGIFVSISNPADVIAHYVQKKLGYPSHKVISTSTTLDSARLRRAVADAFNIDQKSVYGYALGEHGESQMVPWSTVTIAGKPIRQLIDENPSKYGDINLSELANEAKAGGWHILEGKGSTEFGIGASLAEVVRAIFSDEKRVLPVSTLLEGQYGQNDVYASVPCILGSNGVEDVIELRLTNEEYEQFDSSCKAMKEQSNRIFDAEGIR